MDARMRLYPDLDRLRLATVTLHAHLAVYEAHETLHMIQNRLNLQLNG